MARRSLTTYRAIEDLLVACVEQAQRSGDVGQSVDARELGGLLLAAERGIEALGRAGMGEASLRRSAEGALAAAHLRLSGRAVR